MAATAAGAFSEFSERIRPTDNQEALCRGRRDSVHRYLADRFPTASDMPLSATHLIGSAAKRTMIRPVDDIDVLAVFDNAQTLYDRYRWDSRQFIYRVRDALAGYKVKVVGTRGQAVRLFYDSPPEADIAPVLPLQEGGYYLPAGDGTWVKTSPLYDATWLDGRNTALGYQLKPLIRLVKAWNRAHSSWFRSFHLEVMVASTFTSLGSNHREAMYLWFRDTNLGVAGPATGVPLDGYLGLLSSKRTAVIQALAAGRDQAARALDAERRGDHREAIRVWGQLFGSEFPSYG